MRYLRQAVTEALPVDTETRSDRGQHTVYVEHRPACRLLSPSKGIYQIEWRNTSIEHSDLIRNISKAGVKARFNELLGAAEAAV